MTPSNGPGPRAPFKGALQRARNTSQKGPSRGPYGRTLWAKLTGERLALS